MEEVEDIENIKPKDYWYPEERLRELIEIIKDNPRFVYKKSILKILKSAI